VPRRGYTTQPRVSTQVSTLGTVVSSAKSLKGLQIARVIPPIRSYRDLSPLQGKSSYSRLPGLKPWAESYSPFGAPVAGTTLDT
jgi:hypothetical protein